VFWEVSVDWKIIFLDSLVLKMESRSSSEAFLTTCLLPRPTGLEFSSPRYFIFNSVFFPDVKRPSFLLNYGVI